MLTDSSMQQEEQLMDGGPNVKVWVTRKRPKRFHRTNFCYHHNAPQPAKVVKLTTAACMGLHPCDGCFGTDRPMVVAMVREVVESMPRATVQDSSANDARTPETSGAPSSAEDIGAQSEAVA